MHVCFSLFSSLPRPLPLSTPRSLRRIFFGNDGGGQTPVGDEECPLSTHRLTRAVMVSLMRVRLLHYLALHVGGKCRANEGVQRCHYRSRMWVNGKLRYVQLILCTHRCTRYRRSHGRFDSTMVLMSIMIRASIYIGYGSTGTCTGRVYKCSSVSETLLSSPHDTTPLILESSTSFPPSIADHQLHVRGSRTRKSIHKCDAHV